jgi:hypothetical protein
MLAVSAAFYNFPHWRELKPQDRAVRIEEQPDLCAITGSIPARARALPSSVFRDKAGADESVHLAADYVQTHLSKFTIQKPEIIEGPIKTHD